MKEVIERCCAVLERQSLQTADFMALCSLLVKIAKQERRNMNTLFVWYPLSTKCKILD